MDAHEYLPPDLHPVDPPFRADAPIDDGELNDLLADVPAPSDNIPGVENDQNQETDQKLTRW